VAVKLDQPGRSSCLQELSAASQRRGLRPLDVHEDDIGDSEPPDECIKRRRPHLLVALPDGAVHSRAREAHRGFLGIHRVGQHDDVIGAVQGEVLLQAATVAGVRLQGDDPATLGEAPHQERVGPDVRADLEDEVAGPRDLAQLALHPWFVGVEPDRPLALMFEVEHEPKALQRSRGDDDLPDACGGCSPGQHVNARAGPRSQGRESVERDQPPAGDGVRQPRQEFGEP
jgi:hypothetical protein